MSLLHSSTLGGESMNVGSLQNLMAKSESEENSHGENSSSHTEQNCYIPRTCSSITSVSVWVEYDRIHSHYASVTFYFALHRSQISLSHRVRSQDDVYPPATAIASHKKRKTSNKSQALSVSNTAIIVPIHGIVTHAQLSLSPSYHKSQFNIRLKSHHGAAAWPICR